MMIYATAILACTIALIAFAVWFDGMIMASNMPGRLKLLPLSR